MKGKVRIATLFSGIGSPEQAIKRVHKEHEIVFACEFDEAARKSYLANYDIDEEHFHVDVHDLDATQYKGKVDILIGGSPCQAFSIAGLRNGTEDERGKLIYQYIRVVEESMPGVIVYENVKGMLNIDNGRTIKEFVQALREIGYHCHYGVVNTKSYGVPQNRERIFLVGFLDHHDYHQFHFAATQKLEKKLLDILEEDVGEEYDVSMENYVSMHDKVLIPSATLSGYEVAVVGDGINTSFPKTTTGRGKVGKQVAQALVTGNTMGVVVALDRIRLLTPLERLRLHDFDDDFKIVVTKSQIVKQTGNTMSVNILQMIFAQIQKAHQRIKTNTLMDFLAEDTKKRILHINLKGEYFDEIRAGGKPFEFRQRSNYWLKRLIGKDYDEVHFKRGYPKSTDTENIIKCAYAGFEIQTITHKHFGNIPTSVYAIHTTGGAA